MKRALVQQLENMRGIKLEENPHVTPLPVISVELLDEMSPGFGD